MTCRWADNEIVAHTSSGASIAVTSHTTLRHIASEASRYLGILRWTAVHTQRVSVIKHVVSMLEVPRV
jgi:hypothetical protein